MWSVSALPIVLTVGLRSLGAAGFDVNVIEDFQANFAPVIVQPIGGRESSTFETFEVTGGQGPGGSGSVGLDVRNFRGAISATSPILGTSVHLQVDYLARYAAITFVKAAVPSGTFQEVWPCGERHCPPPNPLEKILEATKGEGCLKVTWPEGVLPPPPPEGQVQQQLNMGIERNVRASRQVTINGEKCFTWGSEEEWNAFSTKDSYPVLFTVRMKDAFVDLLFSDYKAPMEPLKELTCTDGQEAAAIEALAEPRTQAFVAALEAHFRTVSRVVGGHSGHPLPEANLTQALLSARRSSTIYTTISLKELVDGSSWVTTVLAIVAMVATTAAAFVAGVRSGRGAEASGYKHLLA